MRLVGDWASLLNRFHAGLQPHNFQYTSSSSKRRALGYSQFTQASGSSILLVVDKQIGHTLQLSRNRQWCFILGLVTGRFLNFDLRLIEIFVKYLPFYLPLRLVSSYLLSLFLYF